MFKDTCSHFFLMVRSVLREAGWWSLRVMLLHFYLMLQLLGRGPGFRTRPRKPTSQSTKRCPAKQFLASHEDRMTDPDGSWRSDLRCGVQPRRCWSKQGGKAYKWHPTWLNSAGGYRDINYSENAPRCSKSSHHVPLRSWQTPHGLWHQHFKDVRSTSEVYWTVGYLNIKQKTCPDQQPLPINIFVLFLGYPNW